jgi:hypothetical protein
MIPRFPNRLFRIQYASHLHLNINTSSIGLTPVAPYLAIAGNTGRLSDWAKLLDWAAPTWHGIFFVKGSEDKGSDYEFHQLAKQYPAVHYLTANSPAPLLEHENVAVVGSPLVPNTGHVASLERQIDYWRNHGANVCVLTHSLPASARLFASPVRLWIHGQSRTASTFLLGAHRTIPCCSNARGYDCYGMPEVAGFMANAFMDIPWADPAELEEEAKRP